MDFRFAGVLKILGVLLMIFSLSMLPPFFISASYHETDTNELSFILAFVVTVAVGFCLWLPFCRRQYELKTRDGFLVVALFWIVLSAFATMPFIIDIYPTISFTDSFFEAVSGFTTTGASVLSHLDNMPHAILYYRQQLHFLGGMGIIVLAVAILPMLGIGGMQLYRAETAGPIKTSKLRPRIAETAKTLWSIYVGLVIACAIAYWVGGMSLFDAVCESFSTLSSGGFSPHDDSFGYYKSPLLDVIAMVFMVLGAINFGLHFQALQKRKLSVYWFDAEFRAYIKLLVAIIVIATLVLFFYHTYSYPQGLLHAAFTVVSLATTTGYITTNFAQWPSFVPLLLMFSCIIGGCGASTAGGIKVIRCMLLKEQGIRELKQIIHPQGVFAVKLGNEVLSNKVVEAIWAFVAVYIALFVVLLLALYATGLDLETAFSALAVCISNTGAGIAKVAAGFGALSDTAKWLLIFAMLAGRLEIFTLLVLFMPAYWRR